MVKKVLAEARGILRLIPVPGGSGKEGEIVEVRHPAKFHGKPEVPERNRWEHGTSWPATCPARPTL